MNTGILEPGDDETFVSFASRALGESLLPVDHFQRTALGCTWSDARRAERHAFDWNLASKELGLPAAQLRAMSERSLFTDDDNDTRPSRSWPSEMPWIQLGYSAYSPLALRRSQHVRRHWLRPDALVDRHTGTLLLRHCPQCGVELAKTKFRFALPDCPSCHEPLSNADAVVAPPALVNFSCWFTALVDRAYQNGRVDPRATNMIPIVAVWHVARSLDEQAGFGALAAHCAEACGVGSIPAVDECSGDIAAAAVRHASTLAAASFLVGKLPEITNSVAFVYHSSTKLVRVREGVERVMRLYAQANGLWTDRGTGNADEPELALSWAA